MRCAVRTHRNGNGWEAEDDGKSTNNAGQGEADEGTAKKDTHRNENRDGEGRVRLGKWKESMGCEGAEGEETIAGRG